MVRARARGVVAAAADPFAEHDLIRPSRPTAAPEFTVSIDTADAATVSRFVKNLSLTFPIGPRDGTAARAVIESLLK